MSRRIDILAAVWTMAASVISTESYFTKPAIVGAEHVLPSPDQLYELGRHHAEDAIDFSQSKSRHVIVVDEVFDPLQPTDSWFVGNEEGYVQYIKGWADVFSERNIEIPTPVLA